MNAFRAMTFSIECAKNYEYRNQFLQVIEDKTGDSFFFSRHGVYRVEAA